jgi:hypothetical protein
MNDNAIGWIILMILCMIFGLWVGTQIASSIACTYMGYTNNVSMAGGCQVICDDGSIFGVPWAEIPGTDAAQLCAEWVKP